MSKLLSLTSLPNCQCGGRVLPGYDECIKCLGFPVSALDIPCPWCHVGIGVECREKDQYDPPPMRLSGQWTTGFHWARIMKWMFEYMGPLAHEMSTEDLGEYYKAMTTYE